MLSVADPDFPLLLGSTDRLLGQAPSYGCEKEVKWEITNEMACHIVAEKRT